LNHETLNLSPIELDTFYYSASFADSALNSIKETLKTIFQPVRKSFALKKILGGRCVHDLSRDKELFAEELAI
jgi:hypothetical protein